MKNSTFFMICSFFMQGCAFRQIMTFVLCYTYVNLSSTLFMVLLLRLVFILNLVNLFLIQESINDFIC